MQLTFDDPISNPRLSQNDARIIGVLFDLLPKLSGRLRFGNPYITLAAARAGFGIARVPDFVAVDDLKSGQVIRLLEKYEPVAPVTMYVVYPHARHLASKVRVFVDFLVERYAKL